MLDDSLNNTSCHKLHINLITIAYICRAYHAHCGLVRVLSNMLGVIYSMANAIFKIFLLQIHVS